MDKQLCPGGRERQAWGLETAPMFRSDQSKQSDNKRTLSFKNTRGHLIAESCIMVVCDCKKGYWHQELDEAPLS